MNTKIPMRAGVVLVAIAVSLGASTGAALAQGKGPGQEPAGCAGLRMNINRDADNMAHSALVGDGANFNTSLSEMQSHTADYGSLTDGKGQHCSAL
jgi:hypothetical protein